MATECRAMPRYGRSIVTAGPQHGHSRATAWPQRGHKLGHNMATIMATAWSQHGHSMVTSMATAWRVCELNVVAQVDAVLQEKCPTERPQLIPHIRVQLYNCQRAHTRKAFQPKERCVQENSVSIVNVFRMCDVITVALPRQQSFPSAKLERGSAFLRHLDRKLIVRQRSVYACY